MKQLDSSHTLTFSNLSCNSDNTWTDGLSLYNYINAVCYFIRNITVYDLTDPNVDFKAAVDGLTGIVGFVEGRRNKFKIDILKLKQDVIQKVGYWQPDIGVNISDPSAFYDSNIANITLVVMTREVCNYNINSRFIPGTVNNDYYYHQLRYKNCTRRFLLTFSEVIQNFRIFIFLL